MAVAARARLRDHGAAVGRRRRSLSQDEPSFDEFELADVGGETIYVVDRTNAGFPLGPTLADLRRDLELEHPGAGWVRAKRVLRAALERERLGVREIGRVTKIGDGLSREVYGACVTHADYSEQEYAILLPRRDADKQLSERTLREVRFVSALRQLTFPFRVPAIVGAVQEGRQVAVVRHFVPGVPLDLRAGRQPYVRPWQIVGEIAAAIHAVRGSEIDGTVAGFATRRAHALDQLTVLDGLEPAEMRIALAWGREHLPPDDPAVLLHGDLLGQNILLSFDGPHHVIDWEYALRGDPAYDLAIVTRGAKRPFQMAGGLTRLLEAYEAHGGHGVVSQHVRLHELCLVGHAYRESLAGRGTQPPAFELDRMRSLVRRLS